MSRLSSSPPVRSTSSDNVIEKILDIARWAPSGDNTQPWRFEIVSNNHVTIHGFDTRDHCVYDLQGHASQFSIGTLLESITIAATEHHLSTTITRRTEQPKTHPTFDIIFSSDSSLTSDPLLTYIPIRTVQRRPMSMKKLNQNEQQSLENALPQGYEVIWLEGFAKKWQTAKLMFINAGLRLTIPEAYEVHKSIIEWNAQYSEQGIPDQALGIDRMTAKMMHWSLQSWLRVNFLNKYLGGTLMPRLQLDLIPSLLCGAHFAIVANKPPEQLDDYVAAGSATQRFWLTATQLNLQIQPEMTPLIFSEYVANSVKFSDSSHAETKSKQIYQTLQALLGTDETARIMFLGRIGQSKPVNSRSTRRPLAELMLERTSTTPSP